MQKLVYFPQKLVQFLQKLNNFVFIVVKFL